MERHGLSARESEVSFLATIFVSKDGALVIGEKTKVDASAVVRAVRSHEVLDLFSVVVVVVIVVAILVLNLGFSTLHPVGKVKGFLLSLIVVVRILVDARVRVESFDSAEVVPEAHILVKTTSAVVVVLLAIAVSLVLVVLAHPLVVFLLGRKVSIEEDIHVENVFAVSTGAPTGVFRGARVGRAKTEANKTLGLDANILFAIGFFVPLGNLVASLELDGVVGDPSIVNLTLIQTTSMLHNLVSKRRIDLNVLELNSLAGCLDGLSRDRGHKGSESNKELHPG
jgi:hypothetical protein